MPTPPSHQRLHRSPRCHPVPAAGTPPPWSPTITGQHCVGLGSVFRYCCSTLTPVARIAVVVQIDGLDLVPVDAALGVPVRGAYGRPAAHLGAETTVRTRRSRDGHDRERGGSTAIQSAVRGCTRRPVETVEPEDPEEPHAAKGAHAAIDPTTTDPDLTASGVLLTPSITFAPLL